MNTDSGSGLHQLASFRIGGLRIDGIGVDSAVDRLLTPSGSRAVHFCNAYTVSLAAKNAPYAEVVNRGALNLADGMPVVWVAKRRKVSGLTARVCGPDVMRACLQRGVARETRHFLYGSTEEVLRGLVAEIERFAPGARVVGMESPAFRELSDLEVSAARERIAAANADIVWVGLGTPKQDYEVERLASEGSATVVAIGAAFDFLAGTKKRAPQWMQRSGLEWAFRLISEPRRLWKRYLVGNMRFAWVVMRGL